MNASRFDNVARHIWALLENDDAEKVIGEAMKAAKRGWTKEAMLEVMDAVATDLTVPATALLELRTAFAQDTKR